MRAKKSDFKRHAIVIKPQDLTYIDQFVRKHCKTVSYRAYCSDSTEIEFESLQDVLDYENPGFKRIVTLEVRGRQEGYPYEPSVTLELGDVKNAKGQTVWYHIVYNDHAWGLAVERELLDRIRELRPSYWLLVYLSFSRIVGYTYFLIFIVLLMFRFDAWMTNRIMFAEAPRPVDSAYFWQWLRGVGFWVTAFLALEVLDRIKGYFFPKVAFYLGKQAADYEKRQRWSKFVFGGVVLTLILNLVASYLFVRLWSQ